MANTFKFGNDNWAVKDGQALAYNDENNNFKPLPFDFTRASIATRVNRQGLVEVVPSGKPRIDFLDNTKGHLLLEPSRTNYSQYSEDFSNSVWTRTNSTVSTNQTVAPDGTVTADRLIESTATGSHDIRQNESGLSSGTQYTYSVFIKAYESGSYRNVVFFVGGPSSSGTFSFSTGTFISHSFDSAKAVNYGNGWYRLEITDTTVSTTFNTIIITQNGTTTNYTGDGSSGFYLWGSQFEQGSFATSYIPWDGSGSTTRSADLCNGAENSTVFNNSQGAIIIELQALEEGSSASRRITLSARNTNNRILLETDETAGVFKFFITGGGTVRAIVTSYNNTQTDVNKIAINYNGTNAQAYINGEQVGSITNATTRTGIDTFDFADWNGTSNVYYGKIRSVKVYDAALTNTELQNLTS